MCDEMHQTRPGQPSPYARRPVLATKFDELACLHHDDTALGSSRNRDASTATEREKSFLPKELRRTQQGVLVDTGDGGEILHRRQAFTGLGHAVGDRSPDLRRNLLVEIGRVSSVHRAGSDERREDGSSVPRPLWDPGSRAGTTTVRPSGRAGTSRPPRNRMDAYGP